VVPQSRPRPPPTKYWLTTVDPNMPLRRLVDLAKMPRRVDRDYEDLKQEIGSGIMRAAAGRASIITERCASQPTQPSQNGKLSCDFNMVPKGGIEPPTL
jgi:hypothetical protein